MSAENKITSADRMEHLVVDMNIPHIEHKKQEQQEEEEEEQEEKEKEKEKEEEQEMGIIDADFKKMIIQEILRPAIKDDIKSGTHDRKFWTHVETWCLTAAQIFAGLSAFAAFASGFFKVEFVSYIAGTLGIIGILMSRFASYAHTQIIQQVNALNTSLESIGLQQWTAHLPPPLPEDILIKTSEPLLVSSSPLPSHLRHSRVLKTQTEVDHLSKNFQTQTQTQKQIHAQSQAQAQRQAQRQTKHITLFQKPPPLPP